MTSAVPHNLGDLPSSGALSMLGPLTFGGADRGIQQVNVIRSGDNMEVEASVLPVVLSPGQGSVVQARGALSLGGAAVQGVAALETEAPGFELRGDGVLVRDGVFALGGPGRVNLSGGSILQTSLVSGGGALTLTNTGAQPTTLASETGSIAMELPGSAAHVRIARSTEASGQVGAPLLAIGQGAKTVEFHTFSGDGFTTNGPLTASLCVSDGTNTNRILQFDTGTGAGYVPGGNVKFYTSGAHVMTVNPDRVDMYVAVSLNDAANGVQRRLVNLGTPTGDTDLATRASADRAYCRVSASPSAQGLVASPVVTGSPEGAFTLANGVVTVAAAGVYDVALTLSTSITGSASGFAAAVHLFRGSEPTPRLSAYEHTLNLDGLEDFGNARALALLEFDAGDTFYLSYESSQPEFTSTVLLVMSSMRV